MRILYVLICVFTATIAHFPGDHTPKEARWCCISQKEFLKCRDLSQVVFNITTNLSLSMNVTCVHGTNVTHCMSRIHRGEADLVTLSEEDIYRAGKDYGLVPVVGEHYGYEDHTSYFAVALIMAKASPSLSLKSLKGTTTCHGRAGDTAGWQVPTGFLLGNEQMAWKSCNPFLSAGQYFKESCVPGAFATKYNPDKDNPSNLCGLCQREDCPPNTSEKYYGYEGAYVCLVERRAQVIFVPHTTVFDFTGILNDLNPGLDFRLLCPDGTRKDVGDYPSCNLARIPASVVMTTDTSKEQFRVRSYRLFLLELDKYLKDKNQLFQLFDSTRYKSVDLLFHDKTVHLADVDEKNTTDEWIGVDYKRALDGLGSCEKDVRAARRSNGPIVTAHMWDQLVLAIGIFIFLWNYPADF